MKACLVLALAFFSVNAQRRLRAAPPQETASTFNNNEAKRAGLTMQAAIFERKAAIATVMVEKYKTAKDMVNAHKQYKIELTSWKKSQALVLKAATAHPLPNADVARAAVQLKVAAEAARVMKQKMDKETDPAKKAVDEMVYKIESGNVVKMQSALKQADGYLTTEDKDEATLITVKAKIAKEKAAMAKHKTQQAKVMKQINGLKRSDKAGRKKLATKGILASEKLGQDMVDLEEYFQYQEHLENALFVQAGKLKPFSVGDSIATQEHIAKTAKLEFTAAKSFTQKYQTEIKRNENKFLQQLGSQSKADVQKAVAQEKLKADAWVRSEQSMGGRGKAPYLLYAVCIVVVVASALMAQKMTGGGESTGKGAYQDIGMT